MESSFSAALSAPGRITGRPAVGDHEVDIVCPCADLGSCLDTGTEPICFINHVGILLLLLLLFS